MRVRVMINPPASDLPAGGAVVRVYIEDTSRMDGAASPVAESTKRIDTVSQRIPVEITCREPVGHESFTVRVHVDTNGSGEVEAGDLVSTATYQAIDGEVEVPVRRV